MKMFSYTLKACLAIGFCFQRFAGKVLLLQLQKQLNNLKNKKPSPISQKIGPQALTKKQLELKIQPIDRKGLNIKFLLTHIKKCQQQNCVNSFNCLSKLISQYHNFPQQCLSNNNIATAFCVLTVINSNPLHNYYRDQRIYNYYWVVCQELVKVDFSTKDIKMGISYIWKLC